MEELGFEIDNYYNSWTSKCIEISPTKCAINRELRIRLINRVLFSDTSIKPYSNWNRLINTDNAKYEFLYPDEQLGKCFCGRNDIKYINIWERDGIKLIVGSECTTNFDGMKERIKEENDRLKTCVSCGNGKHYSDILCKPCIKLKEKLELLKLHTEIKRCQDERVRIEKEKQLNLKLEADRIINEKKLEADRIINEKKLEADRIINEKKEADRIINEKKEADRIINEKKEADRIINEKKEADRIETENKKIKDYERLGGLKLKNGNYCGFTFLRICSTRENHIIEKKN